MKKTIALLLVLVMCLSLCACAKDEEEFRQTVTVTEELMQFAGEWVALGSEKSRLVLNADGTVQVEEQDYGGRAFWWGEHASNPGRLCLEDEWNNLRLLQMEERDGVWTIVGLFNKEYVQVSEVKN